MFLRNAIHAKPIILRARMWESGRSERVTESGEGKRVRENKRVNRPRRNDLIREVEILTSIIGSATGYDPDH